MSDSDPAFLNAAKAFQSFTPKTTRWNESNALAMAYASNLAYKDEVTIRSEAPKLGFNRIDVHSVREVQAYVAGSDTAIIIAFRGTRPTELLDWLTDFDSRQVSFGKFFQGPDLGETHNGFTMGLLRVWERILGSIDEFQSKAQTLWITGHSLGGALAHLAAAGLTFARRMPVNGLYTYGQPRVGDLRFTSECDSHFGNLYFRFVNNKDIVTRVPPRIYPPFFYGHAGQVMYFDESGILHTDETWWNEFLIRFEVDPSKMAGLLRGPIEDHDLVNGYAANIENFINNPKPGQKKPLTL